MPLYLYRFLPRHTLPTYYHHFLHPFYSAQISSLQLSPENHPHIFVAEINLDSELMAETLLMSLDGAETELRLGLPGAGEKIHANYGKRGFEETVDLKLNLSSSDVASDRSDFVENRSDVGAKIDSVKPPAKAQVVGWPPVRSFRKNAAVVQKRSDAEESEKGSGGGATFVKVSMDGAPYLRKVDLKMYKTYQELSDALGKMFGSFTIGKCETNTQGMLDFMNESKLMDLLNSSEYVPTYEDKDGDWMLVGDVPWEMFVGSCKRLCIMKGAEAKGLAPRAMEKCKRRT